MVQSARRKPTIGKRIKDLQREDRKRRGTDRRRRTPKPTATSVSSGASAQSNLGGQASNFLPTEGGSMIGPIAYYPSLVSLSSEEIDISLDTEGNTQKASSYVIVSFSTPGTLKTITGAAFTGQRLYLQIAAGQSLTIEDESNNADGNIFTTDGNDLVISAPSAGPAIVPLMFDPTAQPNSNTGGWVVQSGAGSSGGSGGSGSGTTTFMQHQLVKHDIEKSNPTYLSFSSVVPSANQSVQQTVMPITATLKSITFVVTGTGLTPGSATLSVQKDGSDLVPSHEQNFSSAGTYTISGIDEEYAKDTLFGLKLTPVSSPGGALFFNTFSVEWEVSGSGGGGGVAFPIRPTVTEISSPTATQNLDLNTEGGHVFKITCDKDFTLTFSNPPPSGTQQTFQIELTNDSTSVERTVTLPGTVRQLASIKVPATTPVSRGKYILETNDGGSNYDIQVGTEGLDGNSGATPWAQDIDADGFDLKDLSNIEFRVSSGTPASTVPAIYLDASGDMVQNVAPTDKFFRTVEGKVIEQFQDGEWEVRTEFTDGPTIKLNNNDQTPANGDDVGDIEFSGNDDALSNTVYGQIRVIGESVNAGSLEGELDIRVMHTNLVAPIINYTGSDGTFRFSSGVDVVRPNADNTMAFGSASQSWADSYFANYLQIKEMTAPGNPPTDSGRLYVADVSGTSTLFFKDSAGTETNLISGGGATSSLNNLASVAINTSLVSDTDNTDDLGTSSIRWRHLYLDGNIRFGTQGTSQPTESTIWADGDGDIVYNAPTSRRHFFTINGTTVGSWDATDLELEVPLELNSNDLQYAGTANRLAVTGNTHVAFADSSEVFRYNDVTFRHATKLDMQDNEILLEEMSSAPGATSSVATIFAQDNGSGRTQIMAQFQSGAAVEMAIEPP